MARKLSLMSYNFGLLKFEARLNTGHLTRMYSHGLNTIMRLIVRNIKDFQRHFGLRGAKQSYQFIVS